MGWERHVERAEEMRYTKFQSASLGRPRSRWKDNIKSFFKIVREYVNCLRIDSNVVFFRGRRWTYGNFLNIWATVSFTRIALPRGARYASSARTVWSERIMWGLWLSIPKFNFINYLKIFIKYPETWVYFTLSSDGTYRVFLQRLS
jgi:hypothetical protein